MPKKRKIKLARKRTRVVARPRKIPQRVLQARARYRRDLKILRRTFTGFESRNGYLLKPPQRKRFRSIKNFRKAQRIYGDSVKRVSRKRKLVAEILRTQDYPHVSIRVKNKSKKFQKSIAPFETLRLKGHELKSVAVFSSDPRAKVSAAKDGALRVKEFGVERDVYAFDKSKLASNPLQFYADIRQFMRKHHASNISFNIGGNVIGQVYREKDFDPAQPDALFVAKINEYLGSTNPRKFRDFVSAFQGISVFRGGRDVAEKSVQEIRDLRKARRESRKLSRRVLLTGK